MKFSTLELNELRMAMSCSAKNDVRYYLNGVNIDLKNIKDEGEDLVENVPLVGTNGAIIVDSPVHLFEHEGLPFGKDLILDIQGTIPKYAFKGSFRLDKTEGILTLYKEGKAEPMKVIPVRVIDGVYPNYVKVMEQFGNVEVDEVSFNPLMIADLVKAANIGNFAGVKMLFGNSDMNNLLTLKITERPESKIGLMPIRF